ncbi:tRNA-dihydrouridine(20) synthase [NAD(P)+]-like isoform X2 [Neocloeon triangulifer]|uniref:tRNA-dihydrouridine(20) synthase [NAD(P)+]-like isoform X2 n=1 Tax=Neocloeon triangulifer TaxID=2078957 RepID=UPI00286F7EEE|nr:tRNA-dihydrouridine(20) synthase [NAD(P)+]-like isoform X2 [Neocloeon triangulifer]
MLVYLPCRGVQNKNILAPMVKAGTLPLRLLALRYGADLVYCEELIDWKLLRSVRRENALLGTVDFIDESDGSVVFRTCDSEKSRVVLQLGTCNADRALQVAKKLENDVAAIDINMGCPKEFSLKGGMGAALLTQPEKVKNIITTLVKGCTLPITAKIRLLPKPEDTLAFCKMLQACGVAAIGVHGRTKEQRPRHANNNEAIAALAKELDVPVIANGGSKEIETHEDIDKFRVACGVNSVMLARVALWNVSIFRKEGALPLDEVIVEYLKLAVQYDSSVGNTKYCVQSMLRELQESPRGKLFLAAQSVQGICSLWGLGDFCSKMQEERRNACNGVGEEKPETIEGERMAKRRKHEHIEVVSSDVTALPVVFQRGIYVNRDAELPKTRLLMWSRQNNFKQPVYTTTQVEKLFCSVIEVDNVKYSSSYWEKNKRFAEQGAALAALIILGLEPKEKALKDGSLLSSD